MEPDDLPTSLSLLVDLNDPQRREEAWRLFLERYRSLLRGWCVGRLPSAETEDVVAVILLRLVQSLVTFQVEKRKGPGSFRAWLHKVVESVICDAYRERERRPWDYAADQARIEEAPAPDEDTSNLARRIGENIADDEERGRQIVEAVRGRVEASVWRAFYETDVIGRTPADVAAELNIPRGNVYVYAHRVRKMLRQEGQK